jgi:hypothetical protein
MTISHITTLAELDKLLGKQEKLTVGLFHCLFYYWNMLTLNCDRLLTFMQRTLAYLDVMDTQYSVLK